MAAIIARPCVSYNNSARFQLQGLRARYDLLPAADFGPEGFLMCYIKQYCNFGSIFSSSVPEGLRPGWKVLRGGP